MNGYAATVGAIVRHVLTMLGGILVTKGYIDADALPQLLGAVTTAGGFVWSLIEKRRRRRD